MRILDIGCGREKYPAAVGIDKANLPGVDVVIDFEKKKLPFSDNSFDMVVLKHTIEHVEDIGRLMAEIHRVLKKGGKVVIHTPHFSHPSSFSDITHKHHLTYDSFNYFTAGEKYNYYSGVRFKIIRRRIIFSRVLKIVEPFANLAPKIYENYFSHIFPAWQIYFEMEVEK